MAASNRREITARANEVDGLEELRSMAFVENPPAATEHAEEGPWPPPQEVVQQQMNQMWGARNAERGALGPADDSD